MTFPLKPMRLRLCYSPLVVESRDPVPQMASESRGLAGDDWSARRRHILAQFTTSQLVTVTTRAGDAGADTGQLVTTGYWGGGGGVETGA